MEVFSTLPRTVLPWTANTLTAAALVLATWWSAEQRPTGPAPVPYAAATTPDRQSSNFQAHPDTSQRSAITPTTGAAPSVSAIPLANSARPPLLQARDGVQQVAFQPLGQAR